MGEIVNSTMFFSARGPDLGIERMKTSPKVTLVQVEEVKSPCYLLEMPREIRDHIYTLIFLSNPDIPMYPSKTRSGIADYISLLRTNQQIYSEVVEILYGRNTFQIRGEPRWKAPELLNLLSSQRRDGFIHPSMWTSHLNKICLARLHFKKLYIPSHNINLERLKHLFSLLKYFPNLEYLRVVYTGSFGVKDMEVVNIVRLFRDRRPMMKNIVLCKRIKYEVAEDISWMIWEMPYRNWTSVSEEEGAKHTWKNSNGVMRQAVVVDAPQSIPE